MARQTQTIIESAIAVDPPLVQDAAYKLDAADRQYIDSQVRGCQQHLVDSLLSGSVCTWQEVDSTSAAVIVGDAVVPTASGKVSKATAALLAAAGSAYGIAVTTGVPGGKVRAAIGGRVPRTVTGLAAAAAGFAVINTTTARLEKVAAYAGTDWPAGIIDAEGTLAVTLPLSQGGAVAGTSVATGFSNELYVDIAGNNTTAIRGSAARPYRTLTAALAAAQSGDVARMGPGTWTEDVTLPELAEVSVVGAGMDRTMIVGVAEDATVRIVPATTELQACTIADLTVYNPGVGVGYAIDVVGTGLAAPGNFVSQSSGLVLSHVRTRSDLNAGVRVYCAGTANMHGCEFDALQLRNVGAARVTATICTEAPLAALFDPAATPPTGHTAGYLTVVGCDCGMTLTKVVVASVTGSNVGAVAAALTTHGTDEGYLTATDCRFGTVAVSGDSVDTGANLDGSVMSSLTVTKTGAAAIRVAVSARGGSITGAVSAGDKCDVDIRGSRFVQSTLAVVGDGTIDRDRHRAAMELPDGSFTVTITPPFTTAGYWVGYECSSEAVSTIETTPASKTATGFSGRCTGYDATASYIVIHD